MEFGLELLGWVIIISGDGVCGVESAFITWTGWTFAVAVLWWQHHIPQTTKWSRPNVNLTDIHFVGLYAVAWRDIRTETHQRQLACLAVRIFLDKVTWPYILIARGRERRLASGETATDQYRASWWSVSARPTVAIAETGHFSTRLVFMESTAFVSRGNNFVDYPSVVWYNFGV